MTERGNRRLVFIEGLLLVSPVARIWLFWVTLWSGVTPTIPSPAPVATFTPMTIFLLLSGLALVACIRILLGYLIGGRAALQRIGRIWWGFSGGGIAIAGLGCVALVWVAVGLPTPPSPQLFALMKAGAFGVPPAAVIAHLYLERGRRPDSINQIAEPAC